MIVGILVVAILLSVCIACYENTLSTARSVELITKFDELENATYYETSIVELKETEAYIVRADFESEYTSIGVDFVAPNGSSRRIASISSAIIGHRMCVILTRNRNMVIPSRELLHRMNIGTSAVRVIPLHDSTFRFHVYVRGGVGAMPTAMRVSSRSLPFKPFLSLTEFSLSLETKSEAKEILEEAGFDVVRSVPVTRSDNYHWVAEVSDSDKFDGCRVAVVYLDYIRSGYGHDSFITLVKSSSRETVQTSTSRNHVLSTKFGLLTRPLGTKMRIVEWADLASTHSAPMEVYVVK